MIHPRNAKISIGAGSTVAPGAVIQGSVSIGENSTVQCYSVLAGYGTGAHPEGGLVIGNYVRIAPHVMIIGANHRFDDPDIPICKQGLKMAPVIIEDNVWIGGRVNIICGITVGTGAVIAAGSVVTKDVPPFCVVAGVPAKVIKWRRQPEQTDSE
jgi:acetyltransferase-like isoleucine patch superfamily enzyme